MLKKLLLVSFVLISTYTFSQKNDIRLYPNNMLSTSGIIISVDRKDNYKLKILNSNKKLLFSKELLIEKVFAFKHDFSLYKKGKYIFILEKDNKEVLKTSKSK